MDDFLMTIVTTASNLEDLLEAKPTARGQVLSRFLGLEFLKKKEETGKEIFSEFSKGMMSNVYNTESLKQDNDNNKDEITRLEEEITDSTTKILDVDKRLQKGQEYKDDLLKSKHTDLDQELIVLNPIRLQSDISDLETGGDRIKDQIKQIKIVEPKEYYHEDQHDEVKGELKRVAGELILAQKQVEDIKELIKKYGDGIQCEHCGIKLMEAALTKKKIDELKDWEKKVKDLEKEQAKLEKKEQSFTQLKKDFDEYERNKLIKEKHEISLESNELKLGQAQDKLKRYQEVQDKIKKNNEVDAQLVKAGLRIDELIGEKRGYERIQTSNGIQIKNLEGRIEKNNDIILRIAEEFEREKI
jgi:DNA repair exonuclease SbcCD ATPase subunit